MDLIFLCPNIKSTLAEQDRPSEWLIGWGIASSLIFCNWQLSEIPKWGIRKTSLENYIFWVGRWTSYVCVCVCVLLIISKGRKPLFSFFSIWIQVHLTYIYTHRYQKVKLSRCGSWLPLSDWLFNFVNMQIPESCYPHCIRVSCSQQLRSSGFKLMPTFSNPWDLHISWTWSKYWKNPTSTCCSLFKNLNATSVSFHLFSFRIVLIPLLFLSSILQNSWFLPPG